MGKMIRFSADERIRMRFAVHCGRLPAGVDWLWVSEPRDFRTAATLFAEIAGAGGGETPRAFVAPESPANLGCAMREAEKVARTNAIARDDRIDPALWDLDDEEVHALRAKADEAEAALAEAIVIPPEWDLSAEEVREMRMRAETSARGSALTLRAEAEASRIEALAANPQWTTASGGIVRLHRRPDGWIVAVGQGDSQYGVETTRHITAACIAAARGIRGWAAP